MVRLYGEKTRNYAVKPEVSDSPTDNKKGCKPMWVGQLGLHHESFSQRIGHRLFTQ